MTDEFQPLVLYSAGQNSCYQLGRGGDSKIPNIISIIQSNHPDENKPLNIEEIKTISCGNGFTICVLNNGTAYGWGYNENGCIGFEDRKEKNLPKLITTLTNISMASCGDNATVFLIKTDKDNKCHPFLTTESNGLVQIEIEEEIIYVNCLNSETIWMIGASHSIYHYSETSEPKIKKFTDVKAKYISSGYSYTFLINENDELYGLGSVFNSQDSFIKIESIFNPIEKVVTYNDHSIALTKNHQVYAFGKGAFGSLGLSDSIKNTGNEFIEIDSLSDKEIIDIGVGNSYSCFVSKDGVLYTCGMSKDGRTMMGDLIDRKTPEPSQKVHHVKKVFCGSNHTIVICENSKLKKVAFSAYDNAEDETLLNTVDIEKLKNTIDQLRIENKKMKEENYRLKSANQSLEAENSNLQKMLEKVTKKKIIDGCYSDLEYSNPIKNYTLKEIQKMKKIELITKNGFFEDSKYESTSNLSIQFLKSFEGSPKQFKRFLNHNSQILTSLHPCLNRIIGYSFNIDSPNDESTSSQCFPCLVSEYNETNLLNLLKTQQLNNTDKTVLLIEILLGMRYLHSLNISHNNLNPESIVFSNHSKLAYVGTSSYNTNASFISSKMIEATQSSTDTEIKHQLEKQSDIFAFGTLIYYIYTNGLNPSTFSSNELKTAVDNNCFYQITSEIIENCWKVVDSNQSDEISFSTIFEHIKNANYQIAENVCYEAIEKRVFEIEHFEQKQIQIKNRYQIPKTDHENNETSSPEGDSNRYAIKPPPAISQPAISPRYHSIRKPQVIKPVSNYPK